MKIFLLDFGAKSFSAAVVHRFSLQILLPENDYLSNCSILTQLEKCTVDTSLRSLVFGL